MITNDINIPKDSDIPNLDLSKHTTFLAAYSTKKDDYEYCMTEYLRMSGIYWSLTAMDLMGKLDMMDRNGIIEFIKQCQHDNGGIGGSIDHDPHILYTLSALQVSSKHGLVNFVIQFINILNRFSAFMMLWML